MSLFDFFFFFQTISKTLNPQWREQFDFHLYDEQGGFVDITVWDKDAGKKDDFMGRYDGLYRSVWIFCFVCFLFFCFFLNVWLIKAYCLFRLIKGAF